MIMRHETRFVLDCSVTMAWCFEDEVTEYSETVFDSLTETTAIVPDVWLLEVGNVLVMAERKKRLTHLRALNFKEALHDLPITVEQNLDMHLMSSIYEIAREQKLTIYDAAYLELSLREHLPLATLDKDLRHAATNVKQSLYLQL